MLETGSSAGLGALLPVLQRAQIGSLTALRRLNLPQLQAELTAKGGSTLTAAQRQQLSVLGLFATVDPPRAPVRMERV